MRCPGKIAVSCTILAVGLTLYAAWPEDAEPEQETRMDTYWRLARRELRPWMTVEERALALARWVARNGTNDHRRKGADGVPFQGLCGYRATVYQRLGAEAGLAVRRVALDGFAGSGHAAVEVFWDGAWHYLDVTYAGYFQVDGRILSFDEVQADPERALPGVVVLPGFLDRWRDGTPVDNTERMRKNYTPEHLRAATRLELFEPIPRVTRRLDAGRPIALSSYAP